MKKKLLLIICLFSVFITSAQTTILTNHPNNNGNGSVTFNVQNTNPYDIVITAINCHLGSTTNNNLELLYRTTPFFDNSAPWDFGTIGAGQNGWISAGTAVYPNSNTANGIVTALSSLSLTIPAGSTYQLGFSATTMQYSTLTAGVNTFSSGGVNLITGDGISWGGVVYPSIPGNYPRGLIGGITFIPVVASALNFDGVNDDVSIGSIIASNSSYTKEAWINADASGTCNIISSNDAPFWLAGGQLSSIHTAGGSVLQDPSAFPLGQWVHVAVTFDAATGEMKLYKNGAMVATSVQPTQTGMAISLGQYAGANRFQGSIDEVRIWNVVRTQCEINTFMSCEIPTTATGLLANYHFNQGNIGGNNSTITTLIDASGNVNTGTLNNFALTGTTSNWVSPSAVANGYTTTLSTLLPVAITNSIICIGNSTTLTATGVTSFTWSGGVTNGASISPTITTTYSVSGTSTTTCLNSAVATIMVNELPTITVNSGAICLGQSFTMVPSGAVTYTFSNGNSVATPTTASSYSVIGSDAIGCVSPVAAVSNVAVNVCTPASALDFDGINDFVQLQDPNFGTSDFTIETWIKPNSSTGCYLISTRTYESGSGGNWFALVYNSGKIGFEMADGGLVYDFFETPTPSILQGTWNHVALVRSGVQFSIYVNGILSGSYTDTGSRNFFTGTNSIRLSGWVDYNVAFFNGTMDETRFWNVARTQCEINTFMNCEIPTVASNLLSNYHFNQGLDAENNTISNLIDASASSNTGALVNFALTGTTSNWIAPSSVVNGYTTTLAPVTITVNSGAICAGQSFTMIPTGAVTFTYSNGTNVVTPTADATYSITGTDANTCVSLTSAVSNVTVNALPTIAVNSGTICSGQSFTMVPSGAITYTYSNGTDIVMPTTDATYSVSGTDANGCISSVDAVSNVTVNTLPTIAVNSGTICSGQSFTMVPSGAITYTYSNGTDVVMPTTDATYSVSGTDANGCISSIDAVSNVTVNALPVLTANTTNALLCTGETATLSVTGASSYTWSTTQTTSDIAITPTVQTTYTVDGLDANGCSSSTTITQDVSLCTGIVSLSGVEVQTISVFPNPNNGLFTIELMTTSDVTITNSIGQMVLTEKMEAGKFSLDIHNQSTGIYLIKVIQDGKQHVIKLIKQ